MVLAHVPTRLVRLQRIDGSVQAESQQIPSTQKPVAHCAGVAQAPPCGTGVLVGVEVGVLVGVCVGVLATHVGAQEGPPQPTTDWSARQPVSSVPAHPPLKAQKMAHTPPQTSGGCTLQSGWPPPLHRLKQHTFCARTASTLPAAMTATAAATHAPSVLIRAIRAFPSAPASNPPALDGRDPQRFSHHRGSTRKRKGGEPRRVSGGAGNRGRSSGLAEENLPYVGGEYKRHLSSDVWRVRSRERF